eukprot:CAMPEP_0169169184 /NCGR_PEP_ID=MMETSP1015-20121227/61393_1 /TAXON_ID=342587 /ORGANISM="Karlodinium micrum, Strain CCMP2283" /LENGTH=35 /DNA_ID= /DNA_START= /DNA_END= /DNA_ORIENTATION=
MAVMAVLIIQAGEDICSYAHAQSYVWGSRSNLQCA